MGEEEEERKKEERKRGCARWGERKRKVKVKGGVNPYPVVLASR